MDEQKIIKKANDLFIAEYPKFIRKCVAGAINELATAKDICEMSNNLGCSLDEFIDDICKKLCKDYGVIK